ncbi:MAG: RsmD family RNA methyltransferase, partial [Spirochaetia bacterium]|nr:RsmD family RNA methyltransferase [Spirochaetota bacterium]MDW8113098.1 RsmD family RNA methyltransferase [Spirochaetia bacterium]
MLRISGGYLKGRYIVVKSNSLKPTSETVRQALFNSIDVVSSSFLDMFCGSGIVGIEAISRGASYVCFVEKSNNLTRQLTKNLSSLGINNSSYSLITNTWSSAIKLLE